MGSQHRASPSGRDPAVSYTHNPSASRRDRLLEHALPRVHYRTGFAQPDRGPVVANATWHGPNAPAPAALSAGLAAFTIRPRTTQHLLGLSLSARRYWGRRGERRQARAARRLSQCSKLPRSSCHRSTPSFYVTLPKPSLSFYPSPLFIMLYIPIVRVPRPAFRPVVAISDVHSYSRSTSMYQYRLRFHPTDIVYVLPSSIHPCGLASNASYPPHLVSLVPTFLLPRSRISCACML